MPLPDTATGGVHGVRCRMAVVVEALADSEISGGGTAMSVGTGAMILYVWG